MQESKGENMHFYTSVNINYLPKARILAKTIKEYCPGSKFSLVFSDVIPEEIVAEREPFDEVITVLELGIPVENIHLWIYEHTVVELCTAVKGQALVRFLEGGSDKVVYLDPDIAVFQNLECLNQLLDEHDVVLTPHVTIPETTKVGITDNEVAALKHGIYNFGFYAVKNSKNGLAFARWWRDRLVDYCYDDIPNGIFTDQRWGDLAPAMFEGVYIWKDPGCNVATWNISNRIITKDGGKYYVNGSPLKFYHFSGFDSGSQATMLERYSDGNMALYELRKWYIERQKEEEQERYENYPSKYNFYDNQERVEKKERILFRNRLDIINFFKETNPYVVEQERSYYYWYRDENNHFKTAEKKLQEIETAMKLLQDEKTETESQLVEMTGRAKQLEREFAETSAQAAALKDKLDRIFLSKIGWIAKRILK